MNLRPTSRRSLLNAAAWSAPAVFASATVPAFATSAPIGPVAYLLDWASSGLHLDPATQNHIAYASPLAPHASLPSLPVVIAEEYGASTPVTVGASRSMAVTDDPMGGLGHRALTMSHTCGPSMWYHNAHVLQLRFPSPVSDLRLTVTGIDSMPDGSQDFVHVAGDVSGTFASPAVVVDPAQVHVYDVLLLDGVSGPQVFSGGEPLDSSSDRGNATFSMAPSWRTNTLRVRLSLGGAGTVQNIHLSNITFTVNH